MGNVEQNGAGVIRIKMDESVCQGCRTCESVCSVFHTGATNPRTTGIKILQPNTGEYTANICKQCFDAPCAKACPKGAIVYNEYSYVYEVTDDCTGCGACAKACPFDAIIVSDKASGAMKAYKCDFCGGKPACIEACPRTALSW